MTKQYNKLKQHFEDNYVEELCRLRGYVPTGEQADLIAQMQIGCCEISDTEDLGDMRIEIGLSSAKDNFMLNGRYIVPVEDVSGNLVALIGYYPDYKKYITTPSPFFSKDCMFFNFNQAYKLAWEKYDGFVILVEGIFDCLSIRSVGLPCIATMGSTVSKTKGELLRFFKKVLAVPDDDLVGRAALNRYSRRGWQVPSNTTFLKFHGGYLNIGGVDLHCKDLDNFVSWYEPDDVREILLSFKDSTEDIEEFYL